MAVSVVAICGLLWLNAHTLNKNTHTSNYNLAGSMLSAKRERLETLAYDYSWWDEALANLVTRFDSRWAEDNIGSYLTDTYGVASSFVLAGDDETIVGFVDGQASDLKASDRFPAGLATLVYEARDGPMEEPTAVSGYLTVGEQIHIVAVSALTPENPTPKELEPRSRPVLVLSVPLDESLLTKASSEYNLADLRLEAPTAGRDEGGLLLRGVDGSALARLTWRDEQPGSHLIGQLWPVLAITLVGMSVLLLLAFREAGRVAERQAGLVSLLERERRLRALRSRFVSMISHELRAPLSSIRSSLELLKAYGERMTDEERHKELEKIDQAVLGLTRLAENALPFGIADADLQVWQFERVDLAALCRDVWQQVASTSGAQHSLALENHNASHSLLTDEVVLRVILSNLFQNAIRYSPKSDVVSVTISSSNGEKRIQVTDYGPGIEEDEREKIFEAFRRGRNTTDQEGSGLGLTIARSMAESLGGRLTVRNAPDAGAQFELVLPERPPGADGP